MKKYPDRKVLRELGVNNSQKDLLSKVLGLRGNRDVRTIEAGYNSKDLYNPDHSSQFYADITLRTIPKRTGLVKFLKEHKLPYGHLKKIDSIYGSYYRISSRDIMINIYYPR